MGNGFGEYLTGIKSSADGIKKLYSSVRGLPKNIQELIDGQIEFRDGIASARDDITSETEGFVEDNSPAISFASPDKNHPDSVQYILKTQKIGITEPEEVISTEENDEDFFTRFVDLFR